LRSPTVATAPANTKTPRLRWPRLRMVNARRHQMRRRTAQPVIAPSLKSRDRYRWRTDLQVRAAVSARTSKSRSSRDRCEERAIWTIIWVVEGKQAMFTSLPRILILFMFCVVTANSSIAYADDLFNNMVNYGDVVKSSPIARASDHKSNPATSKTVCKGVSDPQQLASNIIEFRNAHGWKSGQLPVNCYDVVTKLLSRIDAQQRSPNDEYFIQLERLAGAFQLDDGESEALWAFARIIEKDRLRLKQVFDQHLGLLGVCTRRDLSSRVAWLTCAIEHHVPDAQDSPDLDRVMRICRRTITSEDPSECYQRNRS
jgi:hypothetical protein